MTDTTPPDPVYANVVQITTGPYDIVMDFGFRPPEAIARNSTDHAIVSRVAMSLAHAKSMIPLLAKAIATYEQKVGPITTPGFDEMSKE